MADHPAFPTGAGLFVTGTDSDAGKTTLSAALLAAIAASGRHVHAHKPVVTGLDGATVAHPGASVAGSDSSVKRPEELAARPDEPAERPWPADHVLLASVTGLAPEEVAPQRYGPAASPHLAARLAGAPLAADAILAAARHAAQRAAAEHATLVVEGVGGLLVPLADDLSVRDLAAAMKLPLLIAARPRLGTINHTLLTIEAARAAGLGVRAVVFTPWPPEPTAIERSNRETIERIGEVEVATLPYIEEPSRAVLAATGETLPWRRWLG
jgi:dethiobiotin synthetase